MRDIIFSRRFFPLFWTQFFGAFNDNVFKNALIILITYRSYTLGPLDAKLMVSMAAGIFIFPFFIFSATAGQLTDKISKSKIAVWIKWWELLAMIFGAAGFLTESIVLLLVTLFFMGMQSAFFGPVKYSILPELLQSDELMKGNAYVEMGTFIAIPLGTIIGGLAIAYGDIGVIVTALAVVCFAICGIVFSYFVPTLKPAAPQLNVSYNIFKTTYDVIKKSFSEKSILLSIIGISWFWYIGAVFLTVIPEYTKEFLYAGPKIVTLLLVLFSIGIGVGSIVCERLSQGRLELGILPIGTIGMTLFCIDLYFVGSPPIFAQLQNVGVIDLMTTFDGVRIIFDYFMLAFFGGLFIVPLYTLIQLRAHANVRAQMIAANNIWNALFMVISSIMLMTLFGMGFSVVDVFLFVGIVNLFVAVYIYYMLPEFFYRFLSWIIIHIMYRFKSTGINNIPTEGACVVTANHISFIDWMLIMSVSPRPIRFVMYRDFFKLPFVKSMFKRAKLIPIADPRDDRKMFLNAFDEIKRALDNGEIVGIFPEGEITRSGKMGQFKRGIEKIIERNPVPVIPIGIVGMWGSFFSRKYGKAMSKPFKRIWSKISLNVGKPIPPSKLDAVTLKTEILLLVDGLVDGNVEE